MPDEIRQVILNNGLRVVYFIDPRIEIASVRLLVKAGSVDETANNNGVAHFVEHMLFEGTKNRNTFEIYKECARGTSDKEKAQYSIDVPNSSLETAMDLLSDMILNSVFSNEGIEKQRRVILQERGLIDEDKFQNLYTSLSEMCYPNDSIGLPVIGSPENIKNMNRRTILKFFRKYYIPQNSVLVVYANYEEFDLIELAEKYFGKWEKGTSLPKRNTKMALFYPNLYIERSDIGHMKIMLMWEGLNENAIEEFNGAYYLGRNLHRGFLEKEIRLKYGYTYEVSNSINVYQNAGLYYVHFNTDVKNVLQCLQIVQKSLNEEVMPDVLEKQKTETLENPKPGNFNNLMEYARSILCGIEFESYEEYIERIKRTQLSDIHNVSRKVFGKRLSLSIVGNVTMQLEREVQEFYKSKNRSC
ncbi:MAG: M16 family metallopeptidase [Ignavibacteriales bacterium]